MQTFKIYCFSFFDFFCFQANNWLNTECRPKKQGKSSAKNPDVPTVTDNYRIGIVECPTNNKDCKSMNYFMRDQDVSRLIDRCYGPDHQGSTSFYARHKMDYHTYFAKGYGSQTTYELGYQPSAVPMIANATAATAPSDTKGKIKCAPEDYVPDYENIDMSEFVVDVVDLTKDDKNDDEKKPAAVPMTPPSGSSHVDLTVSKDTKTFDASKLNKDFSPQGVLEFEMTVKDKSESVPMEQNDTIESIESPNHD